MAGGEAVQHAASDAGWRLGRRDSGLKLVPKTQTHNVRALVRWQCVKMAVSRRLSVFERILDRVMQHGHRVQHVSLARVSIWSIVVIPI